jgi:chaperone required for assembly of F1-ATPase
MAEVDSLSLPVLANKNKSGYYIQDHTKKKSTNKVKTSSMPLTRLVAGCC